MSYASAMVAVLTDKLTLQVVVLARSCPGEYTVLYPGKTRLKLRLFLPAILAGN